MSQLLRGQKIKNIRIVEIHITTKLTATRDRLGKTSTPLITFKTDRLKSAGIFTVVIT